jgi:excisionase family DNA binding protein
MDDERFLTVDEVSERLRLHPDTVRRMLRKGRIRGHRISRRGGWRIRYRDFERFATGNGDAQQENADTGRPSG